MSGIGPPTERAADCPQIRQEMRQAVMNAFPGKPVDDLPVLHCAPHAETSERVPADDERNSELWPNGSRDEDSTSTSQSPSPSFIGTGSARTTSRIPIEPTGRSPSTTGRW